MWDNEVDISNVADTDSMTNVTCHRWIPRTKASDAELWCFLWCTWKYGWVNNSEADDLRCHCTHYDVTVMCCITVGSTWTNGLQCVVIYRIHTEWYCCDKMGRTWGPSGADRTQVGPMLAPCTCVISMWRNEIKCEYMFMFTLKNLARKELMSWQPHDNRSITFGQTSSSHLEWVKENIKHFQDTCFWGHTTINSHYISFLNADWLSNGAVGRNHSEIWIKIFMWRKCL